jgi:hypothetical protein
VTLRELRDSLATEAEPLSKSLLHARVLAAALGSDELTSFVNREYRGYGDTEAVPEFRSIPCSNTGTFQLGRMSASDQPVPTGNLNDIVRKFAESHEVRESIPQLEHMIAAKNHDGQLYFTWPAEFAQSVGVVNIGGHGLLCVNAVKIVSIDSLVSVVANVRHRLLEIVIALEEQYPDLKTENDLRDIPRAEVTNVFNTYVHGHQPTVAVGANVQQAVQIKHGDVEGLLAALERLGIGNDERQSLKQAISDDQKAGEKPGAGKRVGLWLGGLAAKALEKGVESGLAQAMPQIIDHLHKFLS